MNICRLRWKLKKITTKVIAGRNMDYSVKLKQSHKTAFSSITVWLSDIGDDEFEFDVNSRGHRSTTLATICNNEAIKKKLEEAAGDTGKVCREMIGEFKADFNDTICYLIKLSNIDRVNNMVQMVEAFIKECVSYNKDHYINIRN
ncbi:hypothetical protein [Pedobacter sp. L105]|uniref:hypothetical protein n=1 Tax=Pedobacter sp. L105 TaxID=1641871 RepID=UPI00131E8E15|nr:hypothetical protein [Pedobacter sp. L105]